MLLGGAQYGFFTTKVFIKYGSSDSAYVSQTMMMHLDEQLIECVPDYDEYSFTAIEFEQAAKFVVRLNMRALELDEVILLANVTTKSRDVDRHELERVDVKSVKLQSLLMRELAHWIENNINERDGVGFYGM